MYKVYLSNKKICSSENTEWTALDNIPIEKIELYLSNKDKALFTGFEKYIVLKEMEAIIGHKKPNIISMTVLGKYNDQCYQMTHNLIWNRITQRINKWGREYVPMSFNWKDQKWHVSSGRQINSVLWHEGIKSKPIAKLIK